MSQSPNVFLLIFDTLRADALSCYSESAVPTPNFDRIADRGTRFEYAFAAGPWTPPSHGAIFSGRYPSETGFSGAWPSMPDDVPLLAERFGDAGYETFGVPGPSKMGSPVGLDRGFDRYFEVYEDIPPRTTLAYLKRVVNDPYVRRDAARLAFRGNDYFTEIKFEKLRDTIAELREPWFTMANLTTVHAPYWVPKPYMRRETPELRRPPLGLLEELSPSTVSLDRDDVRRDRLLAAADGAGSTRIAMQHYDTGDHLNHAELRILRAWYRACVRYLDDRLGAFLDWFEASGMADDTVLVLTSDHGEFFGEHDALYHGTFLHDEVMHVPLILSGPGVPRRERRNDLVSLVDLFDTLCDLTDVSAPDGIAGRSMFGDGRRDAVFMEEASSTKPVESVGPVSTPTRRAFECGRKSIRTKEYRFERRSDGSEHLYDASSGERIPDPDDRTVAPLRRRLSERLGDDFYAGSHADVEYSVGVERNLRQLGYIE